MNLTDNTEQKLTTWIKAGTWHSHHDLDQERFFEFINAFSQDHGLQVDESGLTETIAAIADVDTTEENDLLETIRDRVHLMVNILDFLKFVGR